MSSRQLRNPLALAVLAQLFERPMHPYEIASQMRERHLHDSIKLNFGSLYSVVEALQREGLIVQQETLRDTRRPERTVYALSEAGRERIFGWVRQLIGEPAKEYTKFAAGLAFIALLPPAEAIALLEQRARLLEQEIEATSAGMDAPFPGGDDQSRVPRLFLLEVEHGLILRRAELQWIRRLIREIRDGKLTGIEQWTAYYGDVRPAGAEPEPEAREDDA